MNDKVRERVVCTTTTDGPRALRLTRGACVDPKSGRTYFYNQATKERTWNRPAAATVVVQEGGDDGGDPWVERVDPSSGKTYYYHKVTKERKWHKPGTAAAQKKSTDDFQSDEPPEPVVSRFFALEQERKTHH